MRKTGAVPCLIRDCLLGNDSLPDILLGNVLRFACKATPTFCVATRGEKLSLYIPDFTVIRTDCLTYYAYPKFSGLFPSSILWRQSGIFWIDLCNGRSRWPRGLRCVSVTARLLGFGVRIPPGGMDACFLWVLCVVRSRSLRRADHSSRGVLATVISWSLLDDEALAVEPWGLGGKLMSKLEHKLICLNWNIN
jgi:hypothetical protein